ncbi:Putative toxin with S-type pyocin nuclease domain [Candidatus Bodocaedibacter vickermanii]|uniref:Toxin with S-type pyocin nuclease domain n=2 Tax=Candidatus Bodocaedibacter vickermanii TaxID=2741701 RepID=A0A7L9RTN4_9PROT|nr:Putative toxin with S-type pyocin nuclease domain [Candidatus Paracaedibacteraceae bacterium 'Lake Konstanz']
MTAPSARTTMPAGYLVPVRHVPAVHHGPGIRSTPLTQRGGALGHPVRFGTNEPVLTQTRPVPAAAEAPQTRGRPTTERPVQPRASSVPKTSAVREKCEVDCLEAVVSNRPLSLPYIESGRYLPGKAIMSFELTNPPVLMRGTHNNAAKIPLEVAEKLIGKNFKTFDSLKKAFWIEMSKSSYARDFEEVNLRSMRLGNAPDAHPSQWLGERKSYELHHMTPIHDGGAVYDMSNLLISTPKYHKEVLEKGYHYKRVKK